jgi:hypothetical protein
MKFLTCGAMFLPLEELSRGILGAATLTVTFVAPARFSASVDSTVIWCATSAALDVMSTVKLTSVPFT